MTALPGLLCSQVKTSINTRKMMNDVPRDVTNELKSMLFFFFYSPPPTSSPSPSSLQLCYLLLPLKIFPFSKQRLWKVVVRLSLSFLYSSLFHTAQEILFVWQEKGNGVLFAAQHANYSYFMQRHFCNQWGGELGESSMLMCRSTSSWKGFECKAKPILASLCCSSKLPM